MTIADALPCPKCGPRSRVIEAMLWIGCGVYCASCYDCDCEGDPPRYVSRRYVAQGNTLAEAVEDWNEWADANAPIDLADEIESPF